jgi:xanthine dehydrogenase accessory factor
MRREGVGAEHLRRVYSPIGLDIGAITPEEIALAILAEIVLARRGGSGAPKGAEGPMARARYTARAILNTIPLHQFFLQAC